VGLHVCPDCCSGCRLKLPAAADTRFLYLNPQEKRSSYAPKEDEAPVRYDGIYRIRSCWRSKGAQGYLVCRYLFIRCDNAPAPWSSEGRRSPLRHC